MDLVWRSKADIKSETLGIGDEHGGKADDELNSQRVSRARGGKGLFGRYVGEDGVLGMEVARGKMVEKLFHITVTYVTCDGRSQFGTAMFI